jgi:hypothetical protein
VGHGCRSRGDFVRSGPAQGIGDCWKV